jgi:hypothetical protein
VNLRSTSRIDILPATNHLPAVDYPVKSDDGVLSIQPRIAKIRIESVELSSAAVDQYKIQGLIPSSPTYRIRGSEFLLTIPAPMEFVYVSPRPTHRLAIYRYDGVTWSPKTIQNQKIRTAGPGKTAAYGEFVRSGFYAVMESK